MESAPPKAMRPAKKALENYATSYLGAYLGTVNKEKPEHPPALAKSPGYEIEVCVLPNDCIAILYNKSDKQTVTANEREYSYVEGKIRKGVIHMVPLFPHEATTVADAIAKGKKDAVKDIESIEVSSIARAAEQLEKIMQGLENVEVDNKEILELAEQELAKLAPIKDAIKKAGPEADLAAIVDLLRSYQVSDGGGRAAPGDREVLENISRSLGDLNNIIRIVESQEAKLETLDSAMKKALEEFNRDIDERISKGLAVILSASDKKIDKGFAALAGGSRANPAIAFPKELEVRLENIEKMANAHQMQIQELGLREPQKTEIPQDILSKLDSLDKSAASLQSYVEQRMKELQEQSQKPSEPAPQTPPAEQDLKLQNELLMATAALKDDVARINGRIIKIEEFLSKVSTPQQKVRVLKQKNDNQASNP
jgi:transcriptional regulator NrdR family protein